MAAITKFTGLMAAPATPFLPNGELNLSVINKYVQYLASQGVEGVYVNGTTGEGPSLSVEERKLIAEAWLTCAKGILKGVIIQVGGCNNLKDVEELARHAESYGADGIAALPPLFFRPNSTDELVSYCARVASSAPHTPFYYYHFPAISKVDVCLSDFLIKGAKKIATLVGVKYTCTDIDQLATCLSLLDGRFHLLQGYDNLLGASLLAGSRAAIGGTYSFTGLAGNRVIERFKAGDFDGVRREQEHLSRVSRAIAKYDGGFSVLKAAIDLVTPFPVGPPRPPLLPLSRETRLALANDLRSLGYQVQRE